MSDRPDTWRAADSPELLRVPGRLVGHVHPRPLVQARRAGGVLRVDAERYPGLAAALELGEHVSQQRQTDPAPAPGLAHAQSAHPAGAETRAVAPGDRD